MAGERNYVRLPPDGVGKRVQSNYHLQIVYQGLSPTSYTWVIGGEYSLASGATFSLNKQHTITSTTGILFATFSDSDIQAGTVPVAGENILDTDGVTVLAQVTSYVDQYTQAVNVVGGNNPEYALQIDKFGAANIRFGEGPAELSPFNKLLITSQNILANYKFDKSGLFNQFSNTIKNGAVVEWEKEYGHVRLAIDSSGQIATHPSNIWHPLEIGAGITAFLATRLGDVGAPGDGTTRNWGLFGPDEGFFFSLVEDELYVVHRRTFNGVKTNATFVQSVWNRDPLDGTGPSGFILDLTKNNAYFIDYQWIGGGRIRWGVLSDGERIIAHQMNMNNKMTTNGTQTASLPICWSCVATGAVASTKEIFAYGAGIYGEAPEDIFEESPVRAYFGDEDDIYKIPSGSTDFKYMFSLSPEQYYRFVPTVENHSIYQPQTVWITAIDDVDEGDVNVEISVSANTVIRDVNWEGVPLTTVDVDYLGDLVHPGTEFVRFPAKGQGEFDFVEYYRGIQNAVVTNRNEQSISRYRQTLTEITGNNDIYSTGVDRVKLTVNSHPIFGPDLGNVHFFSDKDQVNFRGSDGSTTLTGFSGATDLKTSDGDWYYLSILDKDEAWLYLSSSEIDDDRSVRVMTVDNVVNVTASNLITLSDGATAYVKAISGSTEISVEGRSSGSFDNGFTGTWTTATGGSGNVTSIDGYAQRQSADPNWSFRDEKTTWGRDYWTSLNAVDSSGWADPNDGSTDGNLLYGIPNARARWAFRIKTVKTQDNDTLTRWKMYWKEFNS